MRKKLLTVIAFLCSALTIGLFAVSTPVSASVKSLTVDTGCDTLPSYTGTLSLDAGNYDVYIRLAKRGDLAAVKGYVQLPGQVGNCQLLGNTALQASGDRWVRIGDFSAFRQQEYIFQLSSDSLANLPSANRPSVMIVPKEKPICIPDEQCEVIVNGEKGYVLPPGTLLNKNSLHVLLLADPSSDPIKKVHYYVDDELVYEDSAIKPFDQRYIAYPEQKLKRIIEYESGQRVVIESTAPLDYGDNFGNFLFRLLQRYPLTFFVLTWLGIAIVIASLAVLVFRRLQLHHDERVHHGFARERSPGAFERLLYRGNVQKFVRIAKGVLWVSMSLALIVLLIVLVNRYVFQIATVDGKSMQKTYFTGDKVLVNKIPKTLSEVNRREYVPKRGDIVTVRAVFGIAAVASEDMTDIVLIKRVIGLPGERVVVKDGVLTIYNSQNPSGFQPDRGSSWEKQMTPSLKSEAVDIQLGASELFVTGDNRPESIDSRFSGPLSTKEVIGVVAVKW